MLVIQKPVCNNEDLGHEATRAARVRTTRARRRRRFELDALEQRQVLSSLTGYSFVEQQGLPGPQVTETSSPTTFQTELNRAYHSIVSGQQQIGTPSQTLSNLVTSSIQKNEPQGHTAYNIGVSSTPTGNYSAVLATSGANSVLEIKYVATGNSLNFTSTTTSSSGAADPTYHVTYDITIAINLTFSPNLSLANPVTATASAQIGNVTTVASPSVSVAAANLLGTEITGSIAGGLNSNTADLSNMVPTTALNTELHGVAAQGFTHLHVGVDGSGNLLLTAQKPDLVVNGSANDNIVVASSPSGSAQITEGGQTTLLDAGYLHSITVDTATGHNTVNIMGTPAGVAVNVNDGGTDAVTIGNGSLASIGGPVKINSASNTSPTTVTVDDSADTASSSATITKGSVQFSGLPTVNYSGPGLIGLTVLGGSGNDNFFVQSTAAGTPLSVLTGGGQNDVYVGNIGSLAGLAAPVNVQHSNSSGKTNLIVDDANESGRSATVTSTSVSFTGVSPITYSGMSSLQVAGAKGSNTITVNSVSSATPVTIFDPLHNPVTGPAASSVTIDYFSANIPNP